MHFIQYYRRKEECFHNFRCCQDSGRELSNHSMPSPLILQVKLKESMPLQRNVDFSTLQREKLRFPLRPCIILHKSRAVPRDRNWGWEYSCRPGSQVISVKPLLMASSQHGNYSHFSE